MNDDRCEACRTDDHHECSIDDCNCPCDLDYAALEADLVELARTDPEVARAAAAVDEVVARIVHLESCSTCRYFVPGQRHAAQQHDGTCHINPPASYWAPEPDVDDDTDTTDDDDDTYGTLRTITVNDGSYTGWPIVRSTDWCGEHSTSTGKATR